MKGRESPSDGEIESGTQEEVSAERLSVRRCYTNTSEDTYRHECIGTAGKFKISSLLFVFSIIIIQKHSFNETDVSWYSKDVLKCEYKNPV